MLLQISAYKVWSICFPGMQTTLHLILLHFGEHQDLVLEYPILLKSTDCYHPSPINETTHVRETNIILLKIYMLVSLIKVYLLPYMTPIP